MAAGTTKQQLLAQLQQEYAQWEALLAGIGKERMESSHVTPGWTMKDIIAHLTTWWRWHVARLEAVRRGERPPEHPSQAHVEVINQWVQLTNRDRAVENVIADAHAAWRHFEATLRSFPDEAVRTPSHVQAVGGAVLGPKMVDAFVKHLHEEHMPTIRGWLEQG